MDKENSKTAHVVGILIVLDSSWPNVLPVQMEYESSEMVLTWFSGS